MVKNTQNGQKWSKNSKQSKTVVKRKKQTVETVLKRNCQKISTPVQNDQETVKKRPKNSKKKQTIKNGLKRSKTFKKRSTTVKTGQ